jgi:hypothetical protein
MASSKASPAGHRGTDGYVASSTPAAAARPAIEGQPRTRTRCPSWTSRAPRLSAGGTLPPPSQVTIKNLPESLTGPAERSGCG